MKIYKTYHIVQPNQTMTYCTKVILLILIATIGSYGIEPSEDDDKQHEKRENYGTEVSWPMQRFVDYHENEVGSEQLQSYNLYMIGCYKVYGKELCDIREKERISINAMQPSIQRNFTSAGYAKIRLPNNIFRKLQDFWNSNHESDKTKERWERGSIYTNHWDVDTQVLSLDKGVSSRGMSLTDRREIIDQVQKMCEKWTGTSLLPTSMYGIRIYQYGAILAPHVDRLPLVISAIINVAQDVKEDWILEMIGHDGKAVNLTMQPGDVVLYESHSVIHGRPYKLQGRSYANLFLHYEPVGYSLELERRMNMNNNNHAENGEDSTSNKAFQSQESRAKVLFDKTLKVMSRDTKTAVGTRDGNARRIHSSKLPPHIKEGSLEASRWLQEYVFYRDDSNSIDDSNIVSSKHKKIAIDSNGDKQTPGATSAHIIAASGNLLRLKEIAATNPKSLNEADSNGWKPIHEAVRSGNIEVVELLLRPEYGVDVNERTNSGQGASPLWWAEHTLRPGHPIITLLRRHGAIAIGPGAIE